jgi:hypothetical protein
MVAANQVYHSKVVHAIQAMAMFEAKKAVKRQLQAEGKKISWYSTKDIAIMANALLEERWGEFIAKAKASTVVQEVREECERRERRRLERKSKHSIYGSPQLTRVSVERISCSQRGIDDQRLRQGIH